MTTWCGFWPATITLLVFALAWEGATGAKEYQCSLAWNTFLVHGGPLLLRHGTNEVQWADWEEARAARWHTGELQASSAARHAFQTCMDNLQGAWNPESMPPNMTLQSVYQKAAESPDATFLYQDPLRGAGGAGQRSYQVGDMPLSGLVQACGAGGHEVAPLLYYSGSLSGWPRRYRGTVAFGDWVPTSLRHLRHAFQWEAHVWMGCRRVHAPMHYDSVVNMFLQLHGEKHFRLAPPTAAVDLRLHPRHHKSSCQSQCACTWGGGGSACPDCFNSTCASQWGFLDVTLGPGDVLILPPYTLHEVTAGGPPGPGCFATSPSSSRESELSVSVSLWGDAPEWTAVDALMGLPLPLQALAKGKAGLAGARPWLAGEADHAGPCSHDGTWSIPCLASALWAFISHTSAQVKNQWRVSVPSVVEHLVSRHGGSQAPCSAIPRFPHLSAEVQDKLKLYSTRLANAALHLADIHSGWRHEQAGRRALKQRPEATQHAQGAAVASLKLADLLDDALHWMATEIASLAPDSGAAQLANQTLHAVVSGLHCSYGV